MKRAHGVAGLVVALFGWACATQAPDSVLERAERYGSPVELPAPTGGDATLDEVLAARRSVREFDSRDLPLSTLSRLFWATQGVTDEAGHRTAPSAGARYPLEVYAVTEGSILHYLPDGHRVEILTLTHPRIELGSAAFGQDWIDDAPAVFVISGSVARTAAEYGGLAATLMNREAGHAAQNFLLEATSLGLAAVPVGGFDPAEVARLLLTAPGEEILYLLPVGRAR